MISITDIEYKLGQKEQGKFQIICNEILKNEGYETFNRTGSQLGTEKTILGTPDAIFIKDKSYVFAEFTTYQKGKLPQKIKDDINKCFNLIDSDKLNGKVSKIIFMHNRKQPSLKVIEEIKNKCQKRGIEFIIYGSDYLSDIIQKKYSYIAETHLELKDFDKVLEITKNEIKNSLMPKIKNQNIEKITNKVFSLYEEASKITNIPSSLIYLNDDEKLKLKRIYTELVNLEYIYVEKNTEESKNYYHNILIILQRYDRKEYIKKFKTIEKYGLLSNDDYNFYANNLIMEDHPDEALPILEKEYYEDKNESSFVNMIKCYFLLHKYDKVKNILTPMNIEKYDKDGVLATFLILSKDFIKKLSGLEILNYNKKFKNMPLYYTTTSQLLFKLNNIKYKSQFKKALKCVINDDYNTISIICDISIEINQVEVMANYLMKINSDNELVKLKLIQILGHKKSLTQKEIKQLEKNSMNLNDESIDLEYINGIINENKGLIIKALNKYKTSYINTHNNQSLNKYITLSIKTKSKIDVLIFPKFNEIKDFRIAMLLVEAYKFMGDIEDAINMSYNSLYLSSSSNNQEPYKQFWSIMMMNSNKLETENSKDSIIILKELKDSSIKKFIIENNINYKLNNKIADLTIIKSITGLGLAILGKGKNDIVTFDSNDYKIISIENKYKYLINYCFNIIKDENGIEIITSTENDKEDLEKLSKKISDFSKKSNKILEVYEDKKNLPLSSLISNEYNFDEYAKLINTLLSSNHLLYAGESINVSLENGFVLDITSLITLTFFDKLNILTDDVCKKIYISKTLKNKFDYYFDTLVLSYDEKERTISYDERVNNKYNLMLQEIPNSNKLSLWKKLHDYINKFNIEDTEFELDKIVNNNTLEILDKVQFDLIQVASNKNIPFICDDLFIRQICNIYKVKHTNTNFLINYKISEFNDFIQNLIELSKCNYIYSAYKDEFQIIINQLLSNFTEHNKNLFNELISQLLANKKSKEIYIPFLENMLNNCEQLKYVEIFGEIYENKLAFFLCQTLKEFLQ